MPQIPLENINAAEKMEKCLASSEAQMEYLVSTDLKSIQWFPQQTIKYSFTINFWD